jgi:hypothetical protein
MIRMSGRPNDGTLQVTVLVAFDRSNGRVHGSFVYGAYGEPDQAGVQRSLERLLHELSKRAGSGVSLDSVQYSLEDLREGWIEQVDPKTRKPIRLKPLKKISRTSSISLRSPSFNL